MNIPELDQAIKAREAKLVRMAPLILQIQQTEELLSSLRHQYAVEIQPYGEAIKAAQKIQDRTMGPWSDGCRFKVSFDPGGEHQWQYRLGWLRRAQMGKFDHHKGDWDQPRQWYMDYADVNGRNMHQQVIGPELLKWEEARLLADQHLVQHGWLLT